MATAPRKPAFPVDVAARIGAGLRRTLAAVEETLSHFATGSASTLQQAEVAIAAVRDELIGQLRQAKTPEARDHARSLLDQVNVCISVITAVAYPQGEPKKPPLQEARDILKQLTEEVLG